MNHFLRARAVLLTLAPFLVLVVLMSLFPVYWTFVNSFRDNTQIMSAFRLFPEQIKATNYINVFQRSKIALNFLNSVIIVTSKLLLLSACALTAAFAPHTNTLDPPGHATRVVIAQNRVYHDADHVSRLLLPVVQGSFEDRG